VSGEGFWVGGARHWFDEMLWQRRGWQKGLFSVEALQFVRIDNYANLFFPNYNPETCKRKIFLFITNDIFWLKTYMLYRLIIFSIYSVLPWYQPPVTEMADFHA
jgi:hypothetical protein